MKRFLIPLFAFVALLGFLMVGLKLNPREIPSPLIGRPAPAFRLSQLTDMGKTVSPSDMLGQVWLLNVWASWCVACRQEHPVLVDLARQNRVPVIGLNYKDTREEGVKSLMQMGNPYRMSAFDPDGRVGIDYGVYGVPETFVIDKNGVVRMKYIGPLTPQMVSDNLLPFIDELNRG